MASSSDSGGGGYVSSPVGPAMPGLPIAGKDSNIGSPYEYGKFQNFLPDIKATGQNDMATGLRPDMFTYRSPSGVVAEGGAGNQIQSLRDELAAALASGSIGGGGGGGRGVGGGAGYQSTGYTDASGQFTPYSSTNQMPLMYANGGNPPGS